MQLLGHVPSESWAIDLSPQTSDHMGHFYRLYQVGASADGLLRYATIRQQVGQSCVGEWIAQAQGIVDRRDGIRDASYSSLACYRLAKGQQYVDEFLIAPPLDYLYTDTGTQFHAATESVLDVGFVHEGPLSDGKWPLSYDVLLKAPSMQALNGARTSRRHLYMHVDDLSHVESIVRSGYPVGIAIHVDAEICEWRGSAPILRPRGPVLGSHALTVCTVRSDGCYGCPSTWGPDYADGGIVWVDPTAVLSDIWVMIGGWI